VTTPLEAQLEILEVLARYATALVRTIWETYMGWFKARHTSELYATQPEHVFAELVELAGVDAVVARGRTKLDGGDAEYANLLAEAALAADATHRGALTLALAAHEALLERSGAVNFWETGWLRARVETLRGALERSTA